MSNVTNQIVYSKLRVKNLVPPPYHRKIWFYDHANVNAIRKSIQKVSLAWKHWKPDLSKPAGWTADSKSFEHLSTIFIGTQQQPKYVQEREALHQVFILIAYWIGRGSILRLDNPALYIFSCKNYCLLYVHPQNQSTISMTKKGLSILTQLRVGLSKLNFNKFKHNFDEALNPCARQMVALRK